MRLADCVDTPVLVYIVCGKITTRYVGNRVHKSADPLLSNVTSKLRAISPTPQLCTNPFEKWLFWETNPRCLGWWAGHLTSPGY